MNKPRCQFDKRKNCRCFAFCSPSPYINAQPNPTVKGDLSFTLPLTVGACAVLPPKATRSKSTRNMAQHTPYCSPEQKRKQSVCTESEPVRCSPCGCECVAERHGAVPDLSATRTARRAVVIASITMTTAYQIKTKRGCS